MSKETETAEFIFSKFEDYMAAAKSVIETYGGDVAELGLTALRIEAASTLVLPLVILIMLVITLKVVFRFINKYFSDTYLYTSRELAKKALIAGYSSCGHSAHARMEDILGLTLEVSSYPESEAEELLNTVDWPVRSIKRSNHDERLLFYAAVSLPAAIFGVVAIIGLFNIWAWVGIFYPEAYAIHLFVIK